MAAVLIPTSLPLIPAAAAGLACYAAALLAFERVVFPADLARFRQVASLRGGAAVRG
jgi:hypothetical protein